MRMMVGFFFFLTLAAHASLTYPVKSEAIKNYLSDHPSTNVEQFLKIFPESYLKSFVLVHHSRSLQKGSYEKPRVIFFGPDARFILALGNTPNHPRYQQLEFAEFREETGTYLFGEIDFKTPGSPSVSHPKVCATCHGMPTRPIWGRYPDWKGTYSDERGEISSEDKAGWTAFLNSAKEDPRYELLGFTGNPTSFLLKDHYYPFANTSFNHELGNTLAQGTITRMRRHENFEANQWAVLASSEALECIRTEVWFDITAKIDKKYQGAKTSLTFVKAFRTAGIDPEVELSIENIPPSLKDPKLPRTYGKWQTGAFRLDEAIVFRLLAENADLANHLSDQKELIAKLYSWGNLKDEERAHALTKTRGYYNYFDVFDAITKSKSRHESFCALLSSRL